MSGSTGWVWTEDGKLPIFHLIATKTFFSQLLTFGVGTHGNLLHSRFHRILKTRQRPENRKQHPSFKASDQSEEVYYPDVRS